MAHRIRAAMEPNAGDAGPLGGEGKVLESDETFVGGKAKNVHRGKPVPKKHAVHALVERGGRVSASHVTDVTARTLRARLEKVADRRSALHTDDSLANLSIGRVFAEHRTVAHTLGADSGPSRTPIPTHRGQRSGDRGQFLTVVQA
jgi:hypothetical protein